MGAGNLASLPATRTENQLNQQLADLSGMQQREVDRIIIHDQSGLPVKRTQGAIYKDPRNDPALYENYPANVSGTGLGSGTTYTDPNTSTGTTATGTGLFGRMRMKYANWKDRRRQKKLARQQGEVVSDDSPSPSPDRVQAAEQEMSTGGYPMGTTTGLATGGTLGSLGTGTLGTGLGTGLGGGMMGRAPILTEPQFMPILRI
jgi:hypothetical protein